MLCSYASIKGHSWGTQDRKQLFIVCLENSINIIIFLYLRLASCSTMTSRQSEQHAHLANHAIRQSIFIKITKIATLISKMHINRIDK